MAKNLIEFSSRISGIMGGVLNGPKYGEHVRTIGSKARIIRMRSENTQVNTMQVQPEELVH